MKVIVDLLSKVPFYTKRNLLYYWSNYLRLFNHYTYLRIQ